MYIQAVLKVITIRAARVTLFSPMSVCVSVRKFLSVCQPGSVTLEPLEILLRLTRFSGPHPMGKREAMFENGYSPTYGCVASGLTSLASTVSNI